MDWRRADFAQRRHVFCRAVPLVSGQPITGVLAVQPAHDLITGDLRDDRRCGHGDGDLVAMRERQLSNVVRDGQGSPINNDAVHAAPQRVEGGQHDLLGSDGNARVIDAACGRHGETDGGILEDQLCQPFPLGCREFLGIVNVVEPCQRLSREDDGGCGDGPGKRAASCLVDAGDSARAL